MKKFILIAMLLVSSNLLQAQNDVTKFLGIPVDGTKEEMTRQLIAKGFRLVPNGDGILEGEFNGTDVYVVIATNNRKVCRIGLMDKNSENETDIRVRFNNLCQQFKNNNNYMEVSADLIPDEESVRYGMSLHHKRYEASFCQKPVDINKLVWFMIEEEYGKYRILMFYDNEYNRAQGEDL